MNDKLYLAIISLTLILTTTGVVYRLASFAAKNFEGNEEASMETRKVFFAAALLTGFGMVFTEGMILYYFSHETEHVEIGKDIWDGCTTVIPPLVALVIGYFFGRNSDRKS